jgi:hypothetical protein
MPYFATVRLYSITTTTNNNNNNNGNGVIQDSEYLVEAVTLSCRADDQLVEAMQGPACFQF